MPTESAAASAAANVIATRPVGRPVARIAKPWGEELILERSASAVVKLLRIDPGNRLSLQYHRRKHETLMLLSGAATLTSGGSASTLRDQTLRLGARHNILAGVLHRVSAGGAGAEILEIATRPSGDGEDIVRVSDDYGRVTARSTPVAQFGSQLD